MARPKGSFKIPSYRRHKATGRGVATINGRDVYFPGDYGSAGSERAYQAAIADLCARNMTAAPTISEGGGATVAELCAAYWKAMERRTIKAATRFVYERCLRKLRELFGKFKAADFGPLKLKAFREHLLGAERRRMSKGGKVGNIGGRLKRATVNKYVTIIRIVFQWANENELIPPHLYPSLAGVAPLGRGDTDAPEADERQCVPREHVEETMQYLSPPVAAITKLQLLTAARPDEICQMRTCDIDMTGPEWTYRPETHKMQRKGKKREIILGRQCQDIIRPFMRPEIGTYLFRSEDSFNYWRTHWRGKARMPAEVLEYHKKWKAKRREGPRRTFKPRITSAEYASAIKTATRKANVDRATRGLPPIPRWTPYQIRHTRATEFREQFGIEHTSTLLGHSIMSTTEMYARPNRKKAAEIMAKVG